jgi:hypothetical protein
MLRKLLGLLRLVPCYCGHAAAVHEPPVRGALMDRNESAIIAVALGWVVVGAALVLLIVALAVVALRWAFTVPLFGGC